MRRRLAGGARVGLGGEAGMRSQDGHREAASYGRPLVIRTNAIPTKRDNLRAAALAYPARNATLALAMPAYRIALPVLLLLLAALPAQARCILSADTRASLDQWKAGGFEVVDDDARNARALALADCLGDADPTLRDGIAFEALSTWMRGKRLDDATLRSLSRTLLGQLDGDDADGFRKPFAALVLSEVARTDRVRAWMTPEERAHMADAAAAYLHAVRDYRGHVDGEGWRHGVAHGADWAMQLVLNNALQPAQATWLLAAIGAQVMPADGHAYAFGESVRLARPVLYAVARGLLPPASADEWLAGLVSALGTRPEGDGETIWWRRRSNLENFLDALGFMASEDNTTPMSDLAASARAAARKLP